MRFIGIFAVFILLLNSQKIDAQSLDTYRWKNRIILLKGANLDSDWLQAQLKRLKSHAQELLEREILLFLVNDEEVYNGMFTKTELQVDSIITQFGLTNFEGLVLIGKGGKTKLKKGVYSTYFDIIELIDSMPIRKREADDTKKID